MNNNLFSFLLIPLIIFIVSLIARWIRQKFAQPESQNGIQKPGGFDRLILNFIIFLTFFSAFFTILGFLMQEREMTIAFLVLTLIFIGIVILLRREYNMSYQETADYFLLKAKNKEYKVYYDNIIDWQPAMNEIWVLDKSRSDRKYVKVNIAMLKPEILLQNILDLTEAGRFEEPGNLDEDPQRKNEIINYLIQYNYQYLIEDDLENQ